MKKRNLVLSLALLLTLTSCKVVNFKSFKNEVSKEEFYASLETDLKKYEFDEMPSYYLEYYTKNNYRLTEFYNVSNKTINENNSDNQYITYKYDSSTKVLEVKETARTNETTSISTDVTTKNTHEHYQNCDNGCYYIDMVTSDYSFIENNTYKEFAPCLQYIHLYPMLEAYESSEDKLKYYLDDNVYTFVIKYEETEGENSIDKDIKIQFTLKEKKMTIRLSDSTIITEVDETKTRTSRRSLNENYTLKIKKVSMKAQDMSKFYFHD